MCWNTREHWTVQLLNVKQANVGKYENFNRTFWIGLGRISNWNDPLTRKSCWNKELLNFSSIYGRPAFELFLTHLVKNISAFLKQIRNKAVCWHFCQATATSWLCPENHRFSGMGSGCASHSETALLKVQKAVCWVWKLVFTEQVQMFSRCRSSPKCNSYSRAASWCPRLSGVGCLFADPVAIKPTAGPYQMDTVLIAASVSPAIAGRHWTLSKQMTV